MFNGERADLGILLLVGKTEAADRKADDAEYDQKQSNDGCGFHGVLSALLLTGANCV
jgi:hypothetical protein